MRVLLIAGRSDRPEAHLIVGLQQAGFEVRVLCDTGGPYFPVLRAAGVPATHLVIAARLSPRAVLAIRREVRAFQPEIVHAFTNRALACALPALRGSRAGLVCYRGTTGHLSRWDPASRLTYLHPRVNAIVCVSDAVRDYLLTLRLAESKVVTIRKGHDVAWYGQGPAPTASDLGVPEGTWVAGCVANMRRVKGAHVLLEAMRRIPRERPLHAVFIGDVRDQEVGRLQRDPALQGRIHFTGFRKDATRLMAGFSAVVMPSLEREGLPKAVVEAMAQGVPAVVSSVGGLPELVEDGVSGLVVPPAQAAPLAEALLRLADDEALRSRMGEAARERIERVFNIRHTIAQTTALYRRLAALS
jgi:glycosyltransferase involved in cell wall biosynthesis